MKIKTIKVSDKGQIAIPADIRAVAGIEKGDELFLIQKDSKILLTKVETLEKDIEDEFKDILLFSEKSLKKLWSFKGDEVWNRYLKKK